eukprot:Gb_10587 [translate_table: standard]
MIFMVLWTRLGLYQAWNWMMIKMKLLMERATLKWLTLSEGGWMILASKQVRLQALEADLTFLTLRSATRLHCRKVGIKAMKLAVGVGGSRISRFCQGSILSMWIIMGANLTEHLLQSSRQLAEKTYN